MVMVNIKPASNQHVSIVVVSMPNSAVSMAVNSISPSINMWTMLQFSDCSTAHLNSAAGHRCAYCVMWEAVIGELPLL